MQAARCLIHCQHPTVPEDFKGSRNIALALVFPYLQGNSSFKQDIWSWNGAMTYSQRPCVAVRK